MTSGISRSHRFSTTFNFRDLGGLPTADGRSVRPRRVFRASSLHGLAGDDVAAFTALGVRTVIDLRRPDEVNRHGRVPDLPGLTWHNVSPKHPRWEERPYDETAGQARFLADRYLELVDEGADGVARALTLIADPDRAPVVVHCFAGKDRTGVVCALTLATLGVADADIAADYALSHDAQDLLTEWMLRNHPGHVVPPAHFLCAPQEAMLLFLAELRARYGTVEGALDHLGVGTDARESLRTHLLG